MVENVGVPHLLVVEGYPPLATVIAIGLRRDGHDVSRVGSAQRAKGVGGPFALAVIDIDLPDGDGVVLAERLLASGATSSVVFFTANRDAKRRARAELCGALVDKNQGIEHLVQVVRAELGERADEVAVAMPDAATSLRESGRSGTRRRIR
jgi:DNA-binding response OmpR family regulator